MSEIQDIFKIPVYKTHLKEIDNKAVSKYCLSYSKVNKGNAISNVGGYQSHNLTGEHKPLSLLLSSILSACSTFNTSLQIKGNIVIRDIWMNINGYKDYNQLHHHGKANLSGVYYIQTPPNCGRILFNHPSYDLVSVANNEPIEFNSYNSPRWRLPALAGNLYVFPGYLNHQVEPNMNKTTKRISISFNVFFK